MENGQNMFRDFIMERTQDDKKEAMTAFLADAFKPPEDGDGGGFDPEAMSKRNAVIESMLKPESVADFRKMMNPFGDMDDYDESLEDVNWLAQPNAQKWKDLTPAVSVEDQRAAFACSKRGDEMQCECWNTHCQFYGNCRKCIVFHLALQQFPTCQRCSVLADKGLEESYIAFSQDLDK